MNNTFSPLTSMTMKIFLFCVSAVISSQKKKILFVNTKSMLSLVTIMQHTSSAEIISHVDSEDW